MDKFWVVTLFHFHSPEEDRLLLEELGTQTHHALGIEEFSLTEAEVDEILGERSYSGGDLPEEVLDEVENKVLAGLVSLRFFFDNFQQAKNFLEDIKGRLLCEVQLEEKEFQDWNAEWKKHYSPIKVNDLLEIIPSWEKDYKSQTKEKIFIYPGMGFGTGSHATTFLCLKLFTENLLAKNLEAALDFGSGSGILGLALFKFFPSIEVDFYDIDPEANKNCYQNAQINELQEKSFRLLLPEFRNRLQQHYDLIFANILESILIEEKEDLTSHLSPGGWLILSGLLRHQAPGIIKKYSEANLNLISHQEQGDWAALLFQKRDK